MTREEILERMAKGAEYLERDDLTPEQRTKAQERYAELEAMLRRLEAEEKKRDVPEKVQECIAKIREILGMNDQKSRKVRRTG